MPTTVRLFFMILVILGGLATYSAGNYAINGARWWKPLDANEKARLQQEFEARADAVKARGFDVMFFPGDEPKEDPWRGFLIALGHTILIVVGLVAVGLLVDDAIKRHKEQEDETYIDGECYE